MTALSDRRIAGGIQKLSRTSLIFFLLVAVMLFWFINKGQAGCLPPGGTWIWSPVPIPKGLGIKRIIYKLYRAENSSFDTDIKIEAPLTNEHLPHVDLWDYNPIVLEPQNPLIRSGRDDVIVYYRISGYHHWGQPDRHLDFGRIEQNRQSSFHEIMYWTGCQPDEYLNSVIKIEFSNYVGLASLSKKRIHRRLKHTK